MPFCQYCGSSMPDGVSVCASCGEDQAGGAYSELRRVVTDEYGEGVADTHDAALQTLGDSVDRGEVLAVIPAVLMSSDGILAVTAEELLFASDSNDELEGELLTSIASFVVDPQDGTMVATLDDRTTMAIGCAASPLAAAAFANVLDQAIRNPSPAPEGADWVESTLLRDVRYAGDHPLYPHQLGHAELMVTDGGFGVYMSEVGDDDPTLWLDRDDITLVSFGGNPLAPPSLLSVDTRAGRATFEVRSRGAHELAAELEPLFDRLAVPAADALPTLEERLARLKSLSESGLITDDDYAARR